MDNLNYTPICDLKLNSRNINIKAIILDKQSIEIKTGKVFHFIVSDETGKIDLALFDSSAANLKGGDIIVITKVFVRDFDNRLTLYKSKEGHVYKIGEFTMVFNESNDMSLLSNRFIEENSLISPSKEGSTLADSHRFKFNNLSRENQFDQRPRGIGMHNNTTIELDVNSYANKNRSENNEKKSWNLRSNGKMFADDETYNGRRQPSYTLKNKTFERKWNHNNDIPSTAGKSSQGNFNEFRSNANWDTHCPKPYAYAHESNVEPKKAKPARIVWKEESSVSDDQAERVPIKQRIGMPRETNPVFSQKGNRLKRLMAISHPYTPRNKHLMKSVTLFGNKRQPYL